MLIEHGDIRSDSGVELILGNIFVCVGFVECGENGSDCGDFKKLIFSVVSDGLHAELWS
jgi:hypothetical protein